MFGRVPNTLLKFLISQNQILKPTFANLEIYTKPSEEYLKVGPSPSKKKLFFLFASMIALQKL